MLVLFDGVLGRSSLCGQCPNLCLDRLVLETFSHKFPDKQLLLFNKILKGLDVLLLVFGEFLDELLGALNLCVELFVQVNHALVRVLFLLVLLVLGVNHFLVLFAGVRIEFLGLSLNRDLILNMLVFLS